MYKSCNSYSNRKWYPLRSGRMRSQWLDSKEVLPCAHVFVFLCTAVCTLCAIRNQFWSICTVSSVPVKPAPFPSGRGIARSIFSQHNEELTSYIGSRYEAWLVRVICSRSKMPKWEAKWIQGRLRDITPNNRLEKILIG